MSVSVSDIFSLKVSATSGCNVIRNRMLALSHSYFQGTLQAHLFITIKEGGLSAVTF